MKRIFTILFAISIATLGYSQSQRLVLLEEFTQASCGPCASSNPTIHALLVNNPTKITGIYYHTSWPGTDIMYNHNPADPDARVSYYGVTYVPYSVLDGNFYAGSATGWNINTVNNRYDDPSPCDLGLSYRISSDNDSIYVMMMVKPTAPMSFENAVAYAVVIEKHIHFNTPPGSNGEKDFYNVVKKLLPGKNGQAIPKTMNVGDYFILESSWKLANVYDVNELSAIGFVQNNQNKEILQSINGSVDAIVPLYQNDLQPTVVENVMPTNCYGKVSPVVTIRNNGVLPLTQCEIRYSVNGLNEQVYNFTGNIPSMGSFKVALPETNFDVEPDNILRIKTFNPNGVGDEYSSNDEILTSIPAAVSGKPRVVLTVKTDKAPQETTWEIVDATGNVVKSGGPYANQLTIYKDTLDLPQNACYTFRAFDAGGNGVCCTNGNGMIKLVDGTGTAMFIANQFGDKYENQFFVDQAIGIDNGIANQTRLNIYPNPATDLLNIDLTLSNESIVKMELYDLSGRLVYSNYSGRLRMGDHDLSLEVSGLRAGTYTLRVIAGEEAINRKVVITR